MKKYALLLSSISAALIIGCGNGSSVSDTQFTYDTSSIFGYSKPITYKNYLIKAEDDAILNATVKASNCESFEEIKNGEYLLKKCVGKPLYVEVKGGSIKGKNVNQSFPLLLNISKVDNNNFVVTPLTTLLVTATDKEIQEFAEKLGVSTDELFSDSNKLKSLFPKINAILIASSLQSAITNKVKFIDTVREAILQNIQNGDFNVTNVINVIKQKSQNPNLFGVVIIKDNSFNNTDPLEEIAKMQTSNSIRFYGIVFDKSVSDANISIKDLNTNKNYDANISSGNLGEWVLEVNPDSDLYNLIMGNENHLLQFIATKGKIKLTSTITTKKLKSLINKNKIISPTLEKRLIISNITTAQDAILDKKGALNINSYEGNLSELKVYYQDKLIKAASIIKAVVDDNATINNNADNTYDLVKSSIINEDLDINTSVVDANISNIEANITNNTILSSQLNSVDLDKNGTFENIAKKANYVFYRLLAYYNGDKTDNNFVREYTKIIVYPGHYETKTCYLYGDSTSEWKCDNPKIIENSSNFVLGNYEITLNNETIDYYLDFNKSLYVSELNKYYNLYGIIKKDTNLTSGNIKAKPMILVDSYDVVDAFRRMPDEDVEDFNELKNIVKNYSSKEEVNYALNRWVKKFINQVNNFFKGE